MHALSLLFFFYSCIIAINAHHIHDLKRCGIPFNSDAMMHKAMASRRFKVMGGRDAKWGEQPWAVAIYQGSSNQYICSGTLISTKHVLTAAHCFKEAGKDLNPPHCTRSNGMSESKAVRTTLIKYGSQCVRPTKSGGCASAIKPISAKIVRAYFGDFFAKGCNGYDLALLELDKEIDLDVANYACLPHSTSITESETKNLHVFGWGYDPNEKQEHRYNLQVVELYKIMNMAVCKTKWSSIPEDVICTTEVNTRNVCRGDSGGGILGVRRDGRWVLLGTVSFGSACDDLLGGAKPRAQIYTSTFKHAKTIQKFVNN